MHFDNIQIINEATYEVDIGNIFRYSSALFKNISEHKQRCKISEHINICTVAMNDKIHKQTDKIKYDPKKCHSKIFCSVNDVSNTNR